MSDFSKQRGMLPCVEANSSPRPSVLGADTPFAYLGMGLRPEAFAAYVQKYDFGRISPDYLILHHTANPDASWAPASADSETWWDRDEQGLTDVAIYNKRNKQLDAIRNYYRDSLGWDAGPHLFVDDRYIWLFTPMDTIGIHAKQGNAYRDDKGLHYSVGIEVVGNYTRQVWPPVIARNVAAAVAALKTRLDFSYVARPWKGGIGCHRMYNKPACPGNAISDALYIAVLKHPPPAPPPSPLRYVVRHPCPISETPSPSGPVALGGAAEVQRGEVIEIDEVKAGWAHRKDGLGFLPVMCLEVQP